MMSEKLRIYKTSRDLGKFFKRIIFKVVSRFLENKIHWNQPVGSTVLNRYL